MSIVLINGHVACLKTTLGYLLAPVLQMGHVTTSVLGDFVADASAPGFEAFREARYRAAAAITRQFLAEKVPVLLDGTFARRRWRNAIYSIASEFNVKDIVSVTCVSSDPGVILQRLAYRRCASDTPDSAANHWGAYVGSVQAFESPTDDELPGGVPISRLVFDSANFLVYRECVLSGTAEATAQAIERLIASGRLTRPQFGDGLIPNNRPVYVAKLMIALEGIGGSGKSTQAQRLSKALSAAGKRATVLDEFSSGQIGQFLRSSTGIRDHRLRVTQVPPSHTESLLVIGDAVARAYGLMKERREGLPEYDVLIADTSLWSYLAHALALLPTSADAAASFSIGAAVAGLTNPIRALAEHYQTVLLRVPVEVATERLEMRIRNPLINDARQFLGLMSRLYSELSASPTTVCIDGTGAPEEVEARIIASLHPLLHG